MLGIKLVCVGKMREKYYIDAFSEYMKRLSAYASTQLCEIPEQRLKDKPSRPEIDAALFREAEQIRRQIMPGAYTVVLCIEGAQMKSEGMAQLIAAREGSGKPKLCFIVGGSYGLDEGLKKQCDLRLGMSEMTFPHHLARIMLIEQIYRGFKINEGSQYHK